MSYLIDSIQISALPAYLNKILLHSKYVDEGLSAKKIALLLGCSKTTIKAQLRQFRLTKGGSGSQAHKENLAFGTRLVGHRLISHKGESSVIATISRMYSKEGLRPRTIAGILDTMKIPTKRQGKKWDHSVVIAILKREGIYKKSRKSPRRKEPV